MTPETTLSVPPPAPRHDGWIPDRMATFLEVLADTGLVIEACRAVGLTKQSAYAFRNRNPLFAAAWRAALANARPQVADGLLERSITGTVEHYYRDGVLVGERRHFESWLGLAVLKRLDKQADEDRADQNPSSRIASDWQAALDALRSGGTPALLALLEPEVDQIDSPPSLPGFDPFEAIWRGEDGAWMTNHAPPPGFDGWESGVWDGFNAYKRACTPDEAALLDAHEAAMIEQERRELDEIAQAERNRFFEMLREDLRNLAGEPAAPLPAAGEGLGRVNPQANASP